MTRGLFLSILLAGYTIFGVCGVYFLSIDNAGASFVCGLVAGVFVTLWGMNLRKNK